MQTKLFLQELAKAEKQAGVWLFRQFLSPATASELFETLNSDDGFPWETKPSLYGEKLNQHAYNFKRSCREVETYPGLAALDSLCEDIEKRLDGEVSEVYCNRFQDPAHAIDWHVDTFGRHIMVLSLGSSRAVEFREKATRVTEALRPATGDLYFMPLRLNDTHEHRVCAADSPSDGTRLSFVFFFKTPKYAGEFKISTRDKIKGFFENLVA